MVASGMGNLLPQALGSEFGQFVAEGAELEFGGGTAERLGGLRMQVGGGESAVRRQIREADQSLH